jgi:GNAT superfamily N-acetyltransferase
MTSGNISMPRRASPAESDTAANVILAARHTAIPSIPPLAHTDADLRRWFRDTVMVDQEAWVVEIAGTIVGVMVTTPGWIEQLYVLPGFTSSGCGSALVDHAKVQTDRPLELWTFTSNVDAQRFYLRHGFVEVDRTDGDNEERAPDIRYRWALPPDHGPVA